MITVQTQQFSKRILGVVATGRQFRFVGETQTWTITFNSGAIGHGSRFTEARNDETGEERLFSPGRMVEVVIQDWERPTPYPWES